MTSRTLSATGLLLTTLSLLQPSAAHSWNEQFQIIDANGSYAGDYGYPRGYMSRAAPGFNDGIMTYQLPPNSEGVKLESTDLLCHPSQRTQNQTANYPRLQVAAGMHVAMKYLENGHVTQPTVNVGKPPGSGTVFVYGTQNPSSTETLANVLKWDATGKGGDGQGVLLTAQNFDDGRCHQDNPAVPIGAQRMAEFPDPAGAPISKQTEQWCETDLPIPSSWTSGQTWSIYWVWSWPTAAGAATGYPQGKDQFYTTCSDFDIVDAAKLNLASPPVHTLQQQDPQSTAVSNWASRTAVNPTLDLSAGSGPASATGHANPSPSSPNSNSPPQPSANPSPPHGSIGNAPSPTASGFHAPHTGLVAPTVAPTGGLVGNGDVVTDTVTDYTTITDATAVTTITVAKRALTTLVPVRRATVEDAIVEKGVEKEIRARLAARRMVHANTRWGRVHV